MTADNLPLQAAILAARNVDLCFENAALSAVAQEQRVIIAEQSAALRGLRDSLAEANELIAVLTEANLDREGADPNTPRRGETEGVDQPVTGRSKSRQSAAAGRALSVQVHS